jgi:hypothetical protein
MQLTTVLNVVSSSAWEAQISRASLNLSPYIFNSSRMHKQF